MNDPISLLSRNWWVVLLFGLLAILFGVLTLFSPVFVCW